MRRHDPAHSRYAETQLFRHARGGAKYPSSSSQSPGVGLHGRRAPCRHLRQPRRPQRSRQGGYGTKRACSARMPAFPPSSAGRGRSNRRTNRTNFWPSPKSIAADSFWGGWRTPSSRRRRNGPEHGGGSDQAGIAGTATALSLRQAPSMTVALLDTPGRVGCVRRNPGSVAQTKAKGTAMDFRSPAAATQADGRKPRDFGFAPVGD